VRHVWEALLRLQVAMATRKKPTKTHGWEGHGNGKPPFEGAAPPIHTQQGGKFLKGRKAKKKK